MSKKKRPDESLSDEQVDELKTCLHDEFNELQERLFEKANKGELKGSVLFVLAQLFLERANYQFSRSPEGNTELLTGLNKLFDSLSVELQTDLRDSLNRRLSSGVLRVLGMDVKESNLTLIINTTMPAEKRLRLERLILKRDANELSDHEHQELIELGDENEELDANRLAAVAQLAQIRGVSFDKLFNELELSPNPKG